MRRLQLFYFLLMVFTISQQAISQVAVGVKTGIHFGDARVEGLIENYLSEVEMYEGFTVGGIVEIPLLNGFAFRPEINFIQKGFQTMADIGITDIDIPVGAGFKTRLNYMEMPLLIKYSAGSELAKFYVIAGPNVSYATQGYVRPVVRALIDFTLPRQDLDLSDNLYRRWEISATGGVGGEIKAGGGKIFADVRYNYGFSNIFNNPIIDVQLKNQGFNLSAGYAYHF